MKKIVIIYATHDGHTLEICQRIETILGQNGHQITLLPVATALSMDMQVYDQIIVGASVRYGKHSPQAYEFIDQNLSLLESGSHALFSVNLIARKNSKNQPESNPYLRKFLTQISWQPAVMAVFAGKVDYPSYRFWDRLMIRLIMWMTKGPTDPKATIDFTDWQQVQEFGRRLSRI